MKKMLKTFGIAAVVAVIGFGFASCEGPAGNPGGPGAAGLTPPRSGQNFVVTLGDEDCSLEVGAFFGLFSYDLGNASAAAFGLTSGEARDAFIQGFSRTLTLENRSDYAKFITVGTPYGFDVWIEGINTLTPVMEPGDTLEVTFAPNTATLGTATYRFTPTLIISGDYARGRFERRIDLTFTMGVYADDLVAAIREADIMLLATPEAANGEAIPASAWFVTEAAPRNALTSAIGIANTALTDALGTPPATNALTVNAQNAANAAVGALETAMGTFRGARSAGMLPLVPTTALALTSAATAGVALATITEAEPFSRNLASGIRTAGNGLLIWEEMRWWVYDTSTNSWNQEAVPAGIVLSPAGVLTIAHTVTAVGELYVDVFVYGERERHAFGIIAVNTN